MTVSESISTINPGEWYVVPPKTNKTRTVPLPAILADARAAHSETQARRGAFAPEMSEWPTPLVTGNYPYGSTLMRRAETST